MTKYRKANRKVLAKTHTAEGLLRKNGDQTRGKDFSGIKSR